MKQNHLNYYYWLTDEEYGKECKEKLIVIYDNYYVTTDKKEKEELFKQLEIYLAVVCDVIAYRYLVKHYTNLFYKLCITVEEYMEYKVKRLLVTIRDKKERIEDILSYIYMSFMLSSPRLIYDYGEKIGRCQLVKENLPYYQVARNKFFGITKEEEIEHIIYNVDTLYLDDSEGNEDFVRSNIDKYSHTEWKNHIRMQEDGVSDFYSLLENLSEMSSETQKSKDYLYNLFNNWKTEIESDYQTVQIKAGFGSSYSMLDYIKYKQENNETGLNQEEYLDVLKLLNKTLKGERK